MEIVVILIAIVIQFVMNVINVIFKENAMKCTENMMERFFEEFGNVDFFFDMEMLLMECEYIA